jgi:hypothetical protein
MISRSLRWTLPILVLMCVTVSAHEAQARTFFITGNELVGWMKGYDIQKRGDCREVECRGYATSFLVYVVGVFDASFFDQPMPGGVTRDQLAEVVSKYLKENPKRWGNPASTLVIDALTKAFPLK